MDKKLKNDIDARFVWANERTLLAWIRTAFAFIAGGVTLAFVAKSTNHGLIFGVISMLFGATLAIIGYVRFKLSDHAVRNNQLPRLGIGGLFTTVGVVAVAIALAIACLSGYLK